MDVCIDPNLSHGSAWQRNCDFAKQPKQTILYYNIIKHNLTLYSHITSTNKVRNKKHEIATAREGALAGGGIRCEVKDRGKILHTRTHTNEMSVEDSSKTPLDISSKDPLGK